MVEPPELNVPGRSGIRPPCAVETPYPLATMVETGVEIHPLGLGSLANPSTPYCAPHLEYQPPMTVRTELEEALKLEGPPPTIGTDLSSPARVMEALTERPASHPPSPLASLAPPLLPRHRPPASVLTTGPLVPPLLAALTTGPLVPSVPAAEHAEPAKPAAVVIEIAAAIDDANTHKIQQSLPHQRRRQMGDAEADGGEEEGARAGRYKGTTAKGAIWSSQFCHRGRIVGLGCGFTSAVEAARAHDKAALMFRGLGAEINFPLEDYLEGGAGGPWEDAVIRAKVEAVTGKLR